jgi:hypothetical protein
MSQRFVCEAVRWSRNRSLENPQPIQQEKKRMGSGGVQREAWRQKHRTASALCFSAALTVGIGGLVGCGGEYDDDLQDDLQEAPAESAAPSSSTQSAGDVDVSRNALTTTTSGHNYVSKCVSNGVPKPPDWGASTVGAPGSGKPWIYNGDYKAGYDPDPPDAFFFLDGSVFYSQSTTPPGICVLNEHRNGFFDVICQAASGVNGGTPKACFWEGIRTWSATLPSQALMLADTTKDSTVVQGGTSLADADRCTRCHAGENAFITHFASGHPLNLNGYPGWMPSDFIDPIVDKSFPIPTPATAGYPAGCAACHTKGGLAGRLPSLTNMSQYSGHYCDLLAEVTNRSPQYGGMPAGGPNCTRNQDCPAQTDPAVKAMLADCGGPSPRYPTSISGLAAPSGIGVEFLSGRRHRSYSVAGAHSHWFMGATETMPNAGCCRHQNSHPALKTTDKIELQIYIPADDKPQEVMVQIFNGTTWYRAYWGADKITDQGTRTNKGGLPATNKWVTLSFTPGDLGMTGTNVLSGMKFTLFDGMAWWTDVLFRNSDSPYSGKYVSQMWVGESLPKGAQQFADVNDYWKFEPDNLALGGSTFETTNPYGAGPERGVDGNTSGQWADGSVFHTGTGYNSNDIMSPGGEFWFVDMHGLHTVRRVVLFNRTDCCQDRLSHFRINYWDPVQNIWNPLLDESSFVADAGNPIMGFDVPPTLTGFIMIQKTDSNYLHLAEVEVFGDN